MAKHMLPANEWKKRKVHSICIFLFYFFPWYVTYLFGGSTAIDYSFNIQETGKNKLGNMFKIYAVKEHNKTLNSSAGRNEFQFLNVNNTPSSRLYLGPSLTVAWRLVWRGFSRICCYERQVSWLGALLEY